jgi:type II secretory pathway pseudopilin PulG
MVRSRGYTLVALMLGLTVMTILIASVLPLASAEGQRDREEELIFRGRQYAEAIRVFRRRFGRYPNTLKELYEIKPRSLRKLWKDPITNSDDWGLLSLVNPLQKPPGTSGPQVSSRAPTPTPTPAAGLFGGSGALGPPGSALGPAGPITGVYSKSKKKAFRIYEGRDVYNEWRFSEQSLLRATGAPDAPAGPGGR